MATEKWVMHIVGPDDIIPCENELDALRKANKHNNQFAKLMENETSLSGIYCVAIAKDAMAEEV